MAEVWTPPALDDITTSELVTAAYLNGLGNSLRFLKRVNLTTFSADVSITGTTVGTANQIVSSGAITYENVPHVIEFYTPRIAVSTQQCHLILRDSTTVVGTLGSLPASTNVSPVSLSYPLTPTAASHTYNIAGWVAGASTTTVDAGSGGTAGDTSTFLNGWIAIYRIPT